MKLISRDDVPEEPKQTWTADVWTTFITDQHTVSHFGIAVLWLIVDGGFGVFLRGFLD